MVNFDSYTGVKEVHTENFSSPSEELSKKDPFHNLSENNEIKIEDKETVNRVAELVDQEKRLQDITHELIILNTKSGEIKPEEYSIRKKFLEIETLSVKGDINLLKGTLSTEEIVRARELVKQEPQPKAASLESAEDEFFNEKRNVIIKTLKDVEDKVKSYGYDFDTFLNFEKSEEPDKKKMWEEFEEFVRDINISEDFNYLFERNPDKALDIFHDISIAKKEIFKDYIDKPELSTKKIIDIAFEEIINEKIDSEIINKIEDRLEKDKQEALKKYSVDEILTEWEKELPKKGWTGSSDFAGKIGVLIDDLSREGNYAAIKKIKERIDMLHEKSNFVPSFSESRPPWLKQISIDESEAVKLLTKDLSEESFRKYFDYRVGYYIPHYLLPDFLDEAEKKEYYARVFYKQDLNLNDLKKYIELTGDDISKVIQENPRALPAMLKNGEMRKEVFSEIISQYEDRNNLDQSPKKRIKNIFNSFLVKDNRQELPTFVSERLKIFEEKYGNKGADLIALAISAYGTENRESFEGEMQAIEKVLDKYNPDTIPEGTKVSMGIEYEATASIANRYNEITLLGYKNDIELVSESANIGRGADAVHEIATKPNYNPYMLMAEMKLLQDAGFLDLNFEKYPSAPRGYHLSLVGDRGLSVNKDMNFLNNMMTMAQLTGITAGKKIDSTKSIYGKSFEHFSDVNQGGWRCEIKGMGTDSVEQFEKAVITAHNAGVALQISDKYLGIHGIGRFVDKIGDTPEEFEQILIDQHLRIKPFETDQERDILYEWIKLKNGAINAISQHNDSFIDSEFSGYVVDKNGKYIDTSGQIDTRRNNTLVDQKTLLSEEFKNKININEEDLFNTQNPEFVNALSAVNNIFIKPPLEGDESPVNAKAILDNMKREGSRNVIEGSAQESIFDNKKGELRDGYYYTQGASEEMIIHKAQILLNHFNANMEKHLSVRSVRRIVEQVSVASA